MTSSKETKKTEILVLGSEGQLGSSLIKTLGKNFSVEGINKKKFNFLKPKNFSNLLKKGETKYVINAAAYTNVEQAEIEVDFAKQINGDALKFIAQACNEKKINLNFLSVLRQFLKKIGMDYHSTIFLNFNRKNKNKFKIL